MVFYNLKALIKAIRATKTIADERALIVKESAVIRTSFKEEGELTGTNEMSLDDYIVRRRRMLRRLPAVGYTCAVQTGPLACQLRLSSRTAEKPKA